tara:strand:- start:57 stop:743 length:687 start_codon:yes stop_codon:yes gene_type:complete
MRGLNPITLAMLLIGSTAVGCIEVGEPDLDGDILVIGDSLLDYHAPDADVGTVAGEKLGLEVDMLASGGASMLDRNGIVDAYVNEGHALVIANGGGNDLEGCVCGDDCWRVIDLLISENGSDGAIPDLVHRIVEDGAYVAWVGYMRPMEDAEEYADCGGEVDLLRERLQRLDDSEPSMVFVDGALIGTGVEEHLYDPDGYHPSPEGCATLGEEVAQRIDDAFGLNVLG